MCVYGDIEQPLVGLSNGPTNVMKTRGFEYGLGVSSQWS
jgi:hypothetical protein